MKKILFLALLLGTFASSCTKDINNEVEPSTPGGSQTISFAMPGATKVAVESNGANGFSLSWKVGDVISIYDVDTDNLIGDFTCDDATNSSFSGDGLVDGGSYIAVHPASSSYSTLTKRDADESYKKAAANLTQVGSLPTHLEDNARMRTESFTYNESASTSATFSHEMVYIAVTYITIDANEEANESDQFSLRISHRNAADSAISTSYFYYLYATERPEEFVHTLYFMIDPAELAYDVDESAGIQFLFRYYNSSTSSYGNYYSVTSTVTKTDYQLGYVYSLPVYDTSSTYLIYDEDDLNAFARAVETTVGTAGYLMNDITMTEPYTAPAGKTYSGTFDGRGYSITDLTISDSSTTGFVGLFYTVSGTVKNTTFINPTITSDNTRIGVVAGRIGAGGVISNCSIIGGEVNGDARCGGITGESYGTIKDCYNSATIASSTTYAGGIVGVTMTSPTAADSGVYGCYNEGSISGTNNIGGVVGSIEFSGSAATDYLGRLIGCHNHGSVTGTGTSVGGITGQAGTTGKPYGTLYITGCYDTNYGSIYGNKASADGLTVTLSSNYYLTSADEAGQVTDGVTAVEAIGDTEIGAMNTAIYDFGYQYVAQTDGYPVVEAIE